MMRWRRDQGHTRCRMSRLRDPWIYFFARKMSTFARFCSLRHLDLNLFGTYEISGSYTKTSGSYLFDRGAAVYAIFADGKSFQTLSTFTTIGFSMEMVHCDRQCLVGFL